MWHSFGGPDGGGEILSGRDLVGGGTWLGIHRRTGKFAFLTNVAPSLDTAAEDEPTTSRGSLVRDFLEGTDDVQGYIGRLASKPPEMRGYNLVLGHLNSLGRDVELGFHCNRDLRPGSLLDTDDLQKGVHGISNAIGKQVPAWPKVSLGTQKMASCLDAAKTNDLFEVDQAALEEELFSLMSDNDASTDELSHNILIRPHHRLGTMESRPSHGTWYGTKTQTIILVSNSSRVTFVERDAFEIEKTDDPERLGRPVWRGDDKSHWRRFEFELP